jgi:hypothetical protein
MQLFPCRIPKDDSKGTTRNRYNKASQRVNPEQMKESTNEFSRDIQLTGNPQIFANYAGKKMIFF